MNILGVTRIFISLRVMGGDKGLRTKRHKHLGSLLLPKTQTHLKSLANEKKKK